MCACYVADVASGACYMFNNSVDYKFLVAYLNRLQINCCFRSMCVHKTVVLFIAYIPLIAMSRFCDVTSFRRHVLFFGD
jgi:hypothetical protein